MPVLRLDRIICDAGLATRSEARALIRQGLVTVGGVAVTSPDARHDPETETVLLNGAPVRAGRLRYLMLDKPAGVLTATEDRDAKTVLDLLPAEYRRLSVAPAGRLDKDTTGLLLLTNDGDFAHRVISPKKLVPKRYVAGLDAPVGEEEARAFAAGLTLGDGTKCLPAELTPVGECSAQVVIYEGKYHQVKRMFASLGRCVLSLRRVSIGALELDAALGPGGFRELFDDEKALIFQENNQCYKK